MKVSSLIKFFSSSLMFALLCLPLSGLISFEANAATKNGDVIKIGVAGAHSGDLIQYGMPSYNAAKVIVEQINAKGGINGKKLVIVDGDDQCKPELATNVATKLVSEGVDVVMGHICSGATKAALPIYAEQKIIAISPSATNPDLTQSGQFPYFFRTIASDDMQAKLGVELALDKLGAKNIVILHDKGDYGKTYAEYAKKFIEESGRGKVVLFEGITPGQVDYGAVIQKVRSANVDAIIFGGYHPEASKLVQQMRKKRMQTPFISEDGIKIDAFLKLAGKDAEGVYATGLKDHSQEKLYAETLAAHKKMFGTDPGNYYFEAYSAMMALINAIEKTGGTDSAKIMEVLHNDYIETPLGKIRFTKAGDAEGVEFKMYQVKNGKYTEVK
ncbi:branched-chain amino acid ABC transporter substrate-binding protein [Desulfovibrio litoralis]|uniref:Branched-chain amino acid transport system substrate-binding protein n=1 Tax=Desulfovibrio litoralis DSM 11393 TaxID=1121455 RepID=A0A1M7SLV7_9BACT|nr:branched-chain amino acid ABC transporter substrate-binding protein [Desulfovibrio litoralis]SHN59445.1 branched-chain amino acid transport system substrate-binding protein [Desulfovibrio litoralis DSM 11393]